MKRLKALLTTGLLVALAMGCSTTSKTNERESMLTAAGFKPMPADTPEKAAHLSSLPSGKITTVQRNGKLYYVFPDAKKNLLYVGQQDQYQAYQKLRMQKQLADEQLNTAEMNESAWGAWGPWY
jgi:hypothetical protein